MATSIRWQCHYYNSSWIPSCLWRKRRTSWNERPAKCWGRERVRYWAPCRWVTHERHRRPNPSSYRHHSPPQTTSSTAILFQSNCQANFSNWGADQLLPYRKLWNFGSLQVMDDYILPIASSGQCNQAKVAEIAFGRRPRRIIQHLFTDDVVFLHRNSTTKAAKLIATMFMFLCCIFLFEKERKKEKKKRFPCNLP